MDLIGPPVDTAFGALTIWVRAARGRLPLVAWLRQGPYRMLNKQFRITSAVQSGDHVTLMLFAELGGNNQPRHLSPDVSPESPRNSLAPLPYPLRTGPYPTRNPVRAEATVWLSGRKCNSLCCIEPF